MEFIGLLYAFITISSTAVASYELQLVISMVISLVIKSGWSWFKSG